MAQNLPADARPSRHIPIIASTAHAISEVLEKCLAAGMDDFLVKPFDERQMAETLLRWLKPQRGTTQIEEAVAGDGASANQATPPAEDEVIDTAVIDALRAMARPGRPSPLARALPRFLETAPATVTSIRDHCDRGEGEALWHAAHSLKSSAGALGAKLLSRRCAEIEARAREGGAEASQPLVAFLADDLAAAISGLKAAVEDVHEAA
jgi:HPt (histidine-containing phosphotransfer) domain-containing protein